MVYHWIVHPQNPLYAKHDLTGMYSRLGNLLDRFLEHWVMMDQVEHFLWIVHPKKPLYAKHDLTGIYSRLGNLLDRFLEHF